MIMGILLSFLGASCFASLTVFVACVASARADRIQRSAFAHALPQPEQLIAENGQQSVAKPQLTLAHSSM